MEKALITKKELKEYATLLGANLFGVANVNPIKHKFNFSSEILKDLDYAISIGVRLSSGILGTIEDHPNNIYFHHYRQANAELDRIGFKVASFIESKGFKAMPIPASQITDWEKQLAHISHKDVGLLAGLGFIGRNNLLVNPELGSQFRLVTILTDLKLDEDKPAKETCGECRACISVCPAKAIKEEKRDFDHIACFEKLKEFRNKGYVGQFICGVCVKACKGSG